MTHPALQALYDALASGAHGEALRPLLCADVEFVEHPNAISPTGSRRDLDAIMTSSTSGASLLSSQRYDVLESLEDGARVAVRVRWTGEVSTDAGPFRAGEVLVAHLAQFVRVRDGRIAYLETFDCYAPRTPSEGH